MIGEDSVNSTIEMTHKLMSILLELLKLLNNRRGDRQRGVPGTVKEKKAKVKFGEMTFPEYKKMLAEGEKMRTVNVHSEKMNELKELSKVMGGKYWVLETGGNTNILSVPEKYFPQLQDVLGILEQRQLSKNPGSLSVKDGSELIKKEDMELVSSVLDYYDIPAASFQKQGGDYMNIVPKEFDGQYKAAMETAENLKKEMENIEITLFDETLPLENLQRPTEKIIEVTIEQAEYLYEKTGGDGLAFVKDENGVTAVRFSGEREAEINSILDKMREETGLAENYLITVVDSSITVNKEKLLENENENEYFTRVPNTSGQDYIRISKSEAQLTDGGKTITTKLDYDKTYDIYNKDGTISTQYSGRELGAKYNTKSRNTNKDTEISHHHNDSLERVELFSSKENKLISIGIVSAEVMRRDMAEKGITGYAAEKILRDIDRAMPEEYRKIFDLKTDKPEVSFEAVTSQQLRQYDIAQRLQGCTRIELDEKDISGTMKNIDYDEWEKLENSGDRVCVLDKSTNQYVLVKANEDILRTSLEKMGYDKLHINAVVSEVQKLHTKEGAVLEREDISVHSFETLNAEAQQYSYAVSGDGITIVKGNINGDEANFKYLEVSKEADRGEIENVLKKGFKMQDASAVASIVKCLEDKGILTPASPVVTRDGFEVSLVTSNYVNISKNGREALVDRNNVNTADLCKRFNIDEKQAERLGKAVGNAALGKGIYNSISEIKNAAKQLQKKFSAEKNTETKTPVQSAERSR